MNMETDNPVVRLCAEGMQAEMEGRTEEAREMFEQAWHARRDDFDACVAAHYLARHQDHPQATFEWNREALMRARAVGDDRMQSFYPSLYLNMGHSCEQLGDLSEARRYYGLAAAQLDEVPDGPYKEIVRGGIAGGYKRTESAADERADRA